METITLILMNVSQMTASRILKLTKAYFDKTIISIVQGRLAEYVFPFPFFVRFYYTSEQKKQCIFNKAV